MTTEISNEADARLVAATKTATIALMLGLIIDLANPSLLAATAVEADASTATPVPMLVTMSDYFLAPYSAPTRIEDGAQPQAL